MLAVRIIPCLLFKDRTIVKSFQFQDDKLRMVGDPTTVARVFNNRNADELIFLDIMASRNKKEPNYDVLKKIAQECHMPLTIGGGISKIEHADRLFDIGADKISINSAVITKPELISQIAGKYGSQAIVASIDVKKNCTGYETFIMGGKRNAEIEPLALAKKAEDLGAGEILLNSIDRDGTKEGYDLEIIKHISEGVSIPVIAVGGCGKLQDLADAITTAKASAVCAATIFYYVGESMITIKKYLHDKQISVRTI